MPCPSMILVPRSTWSEGNVAYYGLHEGAAVFFEPLGIFVAILLATGLAFFFEIKADREFAILNVL